MKKLSDLYDCNVDVPVKGIKINSKDVVKDDLFICTMGVTADRHDFVENAIANGASSIVASKDITASVPVIRVENTNLELPKLCARFYDNPERSLDLIGITGTDGKTSVSTITQILLGDDICGYMGTNGRSYHNFIEETDNTTPDSDKLYKYFRDFVENGCKYLAMEASSEAFFRNRIRELEFKVGAITNITKEHLNIHGTFENYLDCKCQLFRQIKKDGVAVLNKDDLYYESFLGACHSKVFTYGKGCDNTISIVNFRILPNKTYITYQYEGREYNITSPLLGEFNVYNLACALLVCIGLGKSIEELIPNISKLFINGRMHLVEDIGQKFNLMIDYAHTPNGIENLMKFVHTLDVDRSIVVIGAAGTRDPYKRPVMGRVAVANASYVIFTYEDPRSEDPMDIINMMISDIKEYKNYEIVVDRSQAIKKAIDLAKDKDMILILGKGCETTEILRDGPIHFNDYEVAKEHLKTRLSKEKINI